jgi:NRAMP (natural resistance-associated macrophage protein)-like metal ion transporter
LELSLTSVDKPSKKQRLHGSDLGLMLAVLGPGIIVAMVDNDAGGIATYSVAGARYGYSVLWILIPTAVLLYMVQEMNARMGIVTGKGLAALIREQFSFRLTAVIMTAVLVATFANTVSEFAGVAASSEMLGIGKYIAVPLAAAAIWWLVLKGSYKMVEKVFLLVSLVYVAYIISAFLARPNWGDVTRGFLVPSGQLNATFIVMVVTIIGTTIAPWMQFYQQSSVVDKGLDSKQLNFERVDTAIGTVFLTIAAAAIVIACAAAFFNKPGVGATQITSAEQAARALAPIAGKYASYLFAFGLLFASIFAGSILPLSTAYAVCEAFGWESGIDRKFSQAPRFYIVYTTFIVGGAAFVLIPRMPLITLMLLSQTMMGMLLPVVLTCMLKIIRDRDVMGDYVNGDTYNTIAWAAVFVLYILDILLVISTVFPIGR